MNETDQRGTRVSVLDIIFSFASVKKKSRSAPPFTFLFVLLSFPAAPLHEDPGRTAMRPSGRQAATNIFGHQMARGLRELAQEMPPPPPPPPLFPFFMNLFRSPQSSKFFTSVHVTNEAMALW